MTGLIPWTGIKDLDRFRTEMDRLFDRFFEWRPFERGGEWMPLVDLSETDNEVLVRAEVPGMDAKDIDITLNGRVLTIRGEKKSEHEEKGENFHRMERSYGAFSRSFQLPVDVDPDKVKASYEKGVLTIQLPKTEAQSVKRIEVKTK